MEGRRVGVRLMAAIMVMTTTMMFRPGTAELTRATWAPGSKNLTEWASQQRFYVGNWIGFWYESNRYQYSVLQVNQTGYEKCIDQGFIANLTRGGGRDVFQLKEATTYYFLSGGGFCWSGLKMAVNVEQVPPPPPPPAAKKSGSPSLNVRGVQMLLPIFFCIIAAISMLYF